MFLGEHVFTRTAVFVKLLKYRNIQILIYITKIGYLNKQKTTE